jgi:hypothetical protein
MGAALPEVVSLLTRALDQLLGESQQAASEGNWKRAKVLMELAERTDRLREEVTANAGEGQTMTRLADVEQETANDTEPDRLVPQTPKRSVYPKYRVRDDILIKQGLQRSGREVYEHSVTRERFDEIVARLANMAALPAQRKPRLFSIEDVQKELDCPRYMTYVVVSLLTSTGLVVRARKGSYRFSDPVNFRSAVNALWERLKGEDAS